MTSVPLLGHASLDDIFAWRPTGPVRVRDFLAEVDALAQAGDRARGATAVVTLEPCHHTGRTGPCTEALLAAALNYRLSGQCPVGTGVSRAQAGRDSSGAVAMSLKRSPARGNRITGGR